MNNPAEFLGALDIDLAASAQAYLAVVQASLAVVGEVARLKALGLKPAAVVLAPSSSLWLRYRALVAAAGVPICVGHPAGDKGWAVAVEPATGPQPAECKQACTSCSGCAHSLKPATTSTGQQE